MKGVNFYKEEIQKEQQAIEISRKYPALFANGNNNEKL
jgi:hypothetical protein